MKRSYFIPTLLLGGVVLAAGLYGIRAASLASDLYAERDKQYSRSSEQNDSRENLLHMIRSNREEATSLRCEYMRLHGLSAVFVGLVFIVWAFDRRALYAQLQARTPGETAGPLTKAKVELRSIAFCGLLLMFAVGSLLHLRQVVPGWVDHVRMRSDQRKAERVRAFLEGKGIPVAHVYWGGGKGGKSITLAGPKVKDISALADLSMTCLDMRNTNVTDLSPLGNSTLRSLSLMGCPVSDISPLVGTKIGFLNLKGTRVSDLRPLAQMPELRRVCLSRQQVMGNLEVLRNLDLTVQEVPGGPAFRTGGAGWQREYEIVDANSVERP